MAVEIDFVPFATADGANVTAQSTWIEESTTSTGFASGVASSADCNKAWRQGTVMAAVLANYIANTLAASVLDNGSLSTLITQLTDAIEATAETEAQTVVAAALAALTLPFTSITGQIANSQVPLSAVQQFQSQLAIGGSQVSGAISVDAAITGTSFNVSSDGRLKTNIKPIENALERLRFFRGSTFRWKSGGDQVAGVIAQDLARALPEGVHEKDGRLFVDPMAVIALLVEMIRELTTRVVALEAR